MTSPMRLARRARPALALALACAGCASTQNVGKLVYASVAPLPSSVVLLNRVVTGEQCVTGFIVVEMPSYEAALKDAVVQVSGATILIDATITYWAPRGSLFVSRHCVTVTGIAARFE